MDPDRFSPQPIFPAGDVRKKLQQELFLTENVDDSKNENATNILHELEDKFKQYRWFVGLALMGSNIRGYSTGSSDVDLKIFYDNSEISNTELTKIVKQFIREIEVLHGFETDHVTIPYFVGFNDVMLEKGLQDINSRDGFKVLLTLKDLSGPLAGEKTQGVFKKIKDLLATLDDEQRSVALDKVVDYGVQEEKLSEEKLMQRLGMKEEDMGEFWKTRRELWMKRIYSLWL